MRPHTESNAVSPQNDALVIYVMLSPAGGENSMT